MPLAHAESYSGSPSFLHWNTKEYNKLTLFLTPNMSQTKNLISIYNKLNQIFNT